MLVIVDTKISNTKSVQNMLNKIGYDSIITSDPKIIKNATKLILPGVGTFDEGISQLKKLSLIECLNDLVINKRIPILGICLGMQLFFNKSEEGLSEGLGWINGNVIKFRHLSPSLKVPHMGWNDVDISINNDLIKNKSKFYFVHSYHVECDESNILLTSDYGYKFVCGVKKDNVYGVQFHPEKSHKYGFELMERFVNDCL